MVDQCVFAKHMPEGHDKAAEKSDLGSVKKIIDIVATTKLEYKLCPPPP